MEYLYSKLIFPILPRILAQQRFEWMFPVEWHILGNWFWLVQSIVVLLYCIYRRQWLPTLNVSSSLPPKPGFNSNNFSAFNSPFMSPTLPTGTPSVGAGALGNQSRTGSTSNYYMRSIFVRQFRFHLITHGVFYIIEMSLTSIWRFFTNMAFHHVAALIIFSLIYSDIYNTVSVATMLPFVCHAIYWVAGAENFDLLTLYNWVFLLCGLSGIAQRRYYNTIARLIRTGVKSTTKSQTWWSFNLVGEKEKDEERDDDKFDKIRTPLLGSSRLSSSIPTGTPNSTLCGLPLPFKFTYSAATALSFFAVTEVAINTFTYCWSYDGVYCPDYKRWASNRATELIIEIG
ncbi:hypothetical protein HK102_007918, partial [Quaeritorhiza haematococci]